MKNAPRTPHPAPSDLATHLKAKARELGFALSGIAPATEADGFPRFRDWLARGYAGEMTYLHTQGEQRRHPDSILETVRSVLMVGMEYTGGGAKKPTPPAPLPESARPTPPAPLPEGKGEKDLSDSDASRGSQEATPEFTPFPSGRGAGGVGLANIGRGAGGVGLPGEEKEDGAASLARVASYAAGPDYHRYIWDRLNALAAWLEAEAPGSRTEAVADTAPLLERDFARRAGLGWVGKNTMLINTRRGSFFFLGAVLTDLELVSDEPFATPHCGTCTACLDACPTGAFPEPFTLDATRCISYLTVELRSAIPPELREPMGNWLYGCDVCQDVCPWNRKRSGEVAFPHDPELAWLDPVELLGLDADAFRARFKKTSLWRNRRSGLLRNAAIVLGNIGDVRALPALEKALSDDEAMIRDAAAWAVEQIRRREAQVPVANATPAAFNPSGD